MTKSNDFTKTVQDMMGSFSVDPSAMQDIFKARGAAAEKLAKISLNAVERSSEIASKWTKDSIARAGELLTNRQEPADYAKAMNDFASATAENAAEHMAALVELVKKVQLDTVDFMLSTGKDMTQDAHEVAEKAAREAQAAVKKATAVAK